MASCRDGRAHVGPSCLGGACSGATGSRLAKLELESLRGVVRNFRATMSSAPMLQLDLRKVRSFEHSKGPGIDWAPERLEQQRL
mmetsp:Transcript_77760/g.186573  ORF Transcript_77760/g.186573 Transcript_77760/m.186573 type:complete len:84 (+) Transcript_77760:595-846(+)